jgi:hypothetical protein
MVDIERVSLYSHVVGAECWLVDLLSDAVDGLVDIGISQDSGQPEFGIAE